MRNIIFLEKGKQIGIKEWKIEGGKKIYFSIAIQKWNDKYIIYIFEIEEDKLSIHCDDIENYEQFIELNTVDEVLDYFNNTIEVKFESLHPLKGVKIFYPK